MIVGLVGFVAGQRHLLGRAEPPDRQRLVAGGPLGLSRERWIVVATVATVLVIWQVLQLRFAIFAGGEVSATEIVASVMTAALAIHLAWFLARRCDRIARDRMIVLVVLTAQSVVFWALYEQSYGTWNAFSDRVMDRHGPGGEWTAAQLTGLGAVFVFVLSPLFAWLWPALARRGANPSTPAKFAGALVLAGLATAVLAWAAAHPGPGGLAGLWSLVLAYFVLELGEMLLSPIGLSAVTTLSVPALVGLMMGAWFLASAFGEILAGRLGTLAALPDGVDTAGALAIYGGLFAQLAWLGVLAGGLALAIAPWLARRMHGG